jgi:hypothetical protein
MTRPFLMVLAALAIGLAIPERFATAQAVNPELKTIATFNTGGGGRWDYPTVDPVARRLYVTRGTRLQVIDIDQRTPIGDVTNLQGAHGTAIVPEKKIGFVTSGRENAVAVFDLENFKVLQKISTTSGGHGQNPDAILYDAASHKVFAFCGGGDAVVIDPANLAAPVVAINCGGKLEFGQSDGAGHVFVNCEDKNDIVVLDSQELKLSQRWSVAPLVKPSGLAIDVAHHRLYSVGDNEKMAVLDSENGKLLATVPIGKGVDGCAFDAKLGVALSANGGDGTVTVVREDPPGTFTASQTVTTVKTGRTIADDPKTSQFLIPATVPSSAEGNAAFGIVVVGATQ